MELVSLAAICGSRAQAVYERLRGAYNLFRPSGSRPVPLLEEWDRVGAFCDDSHCRAMDLVDSKLEAFSAPPVDSIDTYMETKGTDNDKGETVVQGSWQTLSTTSSESNIPDKTIYTVPDWPTEGESECCIGFTQASAASIASFTTVSPAYTRCGMKTVDHSDRFESKVDSLGIAPERLPKLPEMSDGGGVVGDKEEDDIGPGTWSDVTHGMLDEL
ncbi:unnamed protein product [Ectocarpus sp. 12 AP-2014]